MSDVESDTEGGSPADAPSDGPAAADPASDGGSSVRLSVPEMDCPSCASKVESSVASVDGVSEIETRPATGTVIVDAGGADADAGAVTDAIESAGYGVESVDGDDEASVPGGSDIWRSPRAIETGASAVLLLVGLAFEFLIDATYPLGTVLGSEFVLADALFLAAVAVGGREILRGGYYSARNLNLDIDFLMTAAILAAITASVVSPDARLYSEAATLAVLFSVAELLEQHAMDRTRGSLRELLSLSPDTATVRRDGEERTVPVEELSVGDRVVVRPGEKIPLDGEVIDGESAVDESPITGESVPADKAVGDPVYAGSVNQGGYLEVEVTSVAGEDTLSRVIELVEDAQANKTESEQFVDRFSGYYTPVMVAVAILVAAVPPLVFGADWIRWFVAGITMLVLACPCAFVISTPVTVVSGVTSAAKNGVLVKGGDHLEAMGAIEAIALDKTGTLTKGELAVTDVVPIGDRSADEVLACARGVERRSEHPIGEAIVEHASDAGAGTGLSSDEISEFEALTGKGVQASLDGTVHYAGKPGLFDDLGFDLEHVHVLAEEADLEADVRDICDRQGCLNLVEDTIPRLQSEGKTVVLVGTEDELEGIVAVADEIRPGARETVTRLRDLGLEVVMLTGDNDRTARAIAEDVGVDDYRAELLPEEKVAAIESLQETYDGVAMVGDGVNDAPALATADVGVAMGAAGTDTAIETADIALLGDDVTKLPYLSELSRSANGVIRQNIWASLGAKALLAAGVPLGYVSVAAAVLIGDAGMTVGVTGNAMRLSRLTPESFGRDGS